MVRRDSRTERIGVYKAALIITEELEWIFRPLETVDVGVDAILEKSDNGEPSGKLLAAQIKSGLGNFHERNSSFTHYVSNVHHDYWLSLNVPIILIAHIPEIDKTYWQHISKEQFQKTPTHWKINIPKQNLLGKECKKDLEKIIDESNQENFYSDINPEDYDDDKAEEFDFGEKEISMATKDVSDILNSLDEFTLKTHEIISRLSKARQKSLLVQIVELGKGVNLFSKLMKALSGKLQKGSESFAINFVPGFQKLERLTAAHFICTKDYSEARDMLTTIFRISLNFIDTIGSINYLVQELEKIPSDFPKLIKPKKNLISSTEQFKNEIKSALELCDGFIYRMKSTMAQNQYSNQGS